MTTVVAAGALHGAGVPSSGPGWLALDHERIVAVGLGHPRVPVDLDLGDALVAPGFVDLQVNGTGAVDFAEADVDGWLRALAALGAGGATACCPTLVSAPLDRYDDRLAVAARAAAAAREAGLPAVLGVHLEGPFLGGAPGAHPVELLRPADPAWLEGLLTRHPDLVRIVTLAPEADPDLDAVRLLVDAGVVVALGHSTATYEQARAAAAAGASLVTHLFNGMGPLHHRAPGLAGAALDDDRLTPTLIADGVHVHPALLRLAFARKESVCLVTDAVAVGGGGSPGLVARDGAAWLDDGTLAGSLLTMAGAVRHATELGLTTGRAVALASRLPARALGLGDRGVLRAGARADLVALDPETLDVRGVWVGGRRLTTDGAPAARG